MSSQIQPGGSLLIAWQLKDRRVLIVGGGEVASQRLTSVLSADALVTLICPVSGLHPRISHLVASSTQITYHDRTFSGPDDLTGVDMVLTAIDDVTASREICALCRTLRIPVNVADVPPSCDFYFGAQVRRGPLQIMISTNGNGPKLASMIKQRIDDALPENVGIAIEKVGLLREKLRQRAPGVGGDLGKRRMKWITSVCEAWSMDQLSELDQESMNRLLDEGWERDVVMHPLDILPAQSRPYLRNAWPLELRSFSVGLATGLLVAVLVARRPLK